METLIVGTEVLECGHLESPHSACTRGYGTERGTCKRLCYTCCVAADLAHAQEHGWLACYVSGDETRITTWHGLELATITRKRLHKARWNNLGRWQDAYITYDATMADGSRWYGRGSGSMQTTMRRKVSK